MGKEQRHLSIVKPSEQSHIVEMHPPRQLTDEEQSILRNTSAVRFSQVRNPRQITDDGSIPYRVFPVEYESAGRALEERIAESLQREDLIVIVNDPKRVVTGLMKTRKGTTRVVTISREVGVNAEIRTLVTPIVACEFTQDGFHISLGNEGAEEPLFEGVSPYRVPLSKQFSIRSIDQDGKSDILLVGGASQMTKTPLDLVIDEQLTREVEAGKRKYTSDIINGFHQNWYLGGDGMNNIFPQSE